MEMYTSIDFKKKIENSISNGNELYVELEKYVYNQILNLYK